MNTSGRARDTRPVIGSGETVSAVLQSGQTARTVGWHWGWTVRALSPARRVVMGYMVGERYRGGEGLYQINTPPWALSSGA